MGRPWPCEAAGRSHIHSSAAYLNDERNLPWLPSVDTLPAETERGGDRDRERRVWLLS